MPGDKATAVSSPPPAQFTGLFDSGSMMWLVNRERLVLLGGPAAAVLQVTHPMVALGVTRHSAFRTDVLGRLHRTLDAVYAVAFGTIEEVETVRSRIALAHRRVRGAGYSAFDPGAQLWVLATLVHGSISLFERFVRPLTLGEKTALLVENRAFGEIFGSGGVLLPGSWPDFLAYWRGMLEGPLLGSRPECGEAARAVVQPASPWWLGALSPLLCALANEWIPRALRERLALPETPIQGPVWKALDRALPAILPWMPRRWRFAPQYLKACERSADAGRGRFRGCAAGSRTLRNHLP